MNTEIGVNIKGFFSRAMEKKEKTCSSYKRASIHPHQKKTTAKIAKIVVLQ